MSPVPTTCNALLEDGSKCAEAVTVTKTHYLYDRKPIVGDPATYTLKETHYHARCPKCGEREIVEVHGGAA
jgi:hypothetical protein